MSDVGTAPPPAPAPASAPATVPAVGEVPINPNPVSPPQPIGSQAPPAREQSPQGRREATRETIRKAFARSSEPGPAKPKMGHTQPPEPMAKEPPKPAKTDGRDARDAAFDLKKRPSADADRPRAEHGHFAARTPEELRLDPAAARQAQAGPAAAAAPGQPAAPINAVALPAGAPYREPLKRLSERAKAEWGAAPESVRAEVWRMHKEYSTYAQKLRGDAEAFAPVKQYHELARSHGTTLQKALSNYVGIEDKLRTDPIGGLDVIVNNLNLRTPEGQRIGLRDIAWHVLNQTPDQHKALRMENSQTAIAHQLGQLHQQQQAIAQGMQRLQYERAFSQTRSEVDRFAETHPRLDELGDLIEQELRVGYDLPTAYRRAELLRPATHAAQTRTPTAQTRTSDRSIRGAPDGGQVNGQHHQGMRSKTPLSRRDAIARNMKRVAGAL